MRELVRRSRLDPTRDLQEMRQLVRDAVADYDERSLHGGLPTLLDLGEATKSVLDAVAGFRPLQQYPRRPAIEEICSHRLGASYARPDLHYARPDLLKTMRGRRIASRFASMSPRLLAHPKKKIVNQEFLSV